MALPSNFIHVIKFHFMTAFSNQQTIISEDTIQEDTTDAITNGNGKDTDTVLSVQNLTSSTGTNNDLVADSAASQKGMILPFTPLAMSFDSVNYYVDMPSVRILISIFNFYVSFIYSKMRRKSYPSLCVIATNNLTTRFSFCAGNEESRGDRGQASVASGSDWKL